MPREFPKPDDSQTVAMNDEVKTPDTPEAAPNMEPPLEFPAEVEADPKDAEIAALKEETAGLKDKILRLAAEMDNLRKRTEREKAEATLYAATNFARELLTVADNMDRAIAAVPPENRESADETTKNLLAGVEVTARELLNVFQRHGIRRVETLGQKFDPHYHQAMFEVPSSSEVPGTVVQELQAGYAIGERCLRPALVGVAKAG
jgi:molecular chaperone GrpE